MLEHQIAQREGLLSGILTNKGNTLEELSLKQPVLLIFLRHFGCVFCRESLKDISNKKRTLIEKGIRIVFVHLSDDQTAAEYFARYGLKDIEFVSDPETKIYADFGLTKGAFSQLFGLQVMLRGFEATLFKSIPFGLKQIGDGFQMPGIFLIRNGEITDSYIHKKISDRPDYEQMIACSS